MRFLAVVCALILVCIPALACNSNSGESSCASNCHACNQFTPCCDSNDICGGGHGSPGLFCSRFDQICH
jgi:hypothetical protein